MKRSVFALLAIIVTTALLADSLSTEIKIDAVARHEKTVGVSNIVDAAAVEYAKYMHYGTSASECDRSYHYSGTVASSASASFDMNGALADAFGAVATFTSVKFVTAVNDSTTDTIAIGGGATDIAGIGRVTIPPSGCVVMCGPLGGWPVASGADTITVVVASGSSAAYRLLITGTSL
jgi:hypothetical protein